MFRYLQTASLRKQLLLGLGVCIACGLLIAGLFVAITKSQVRHMLNEDMSKMARYVAGLVESDYEAKKNQAQQLAQENALRVVLDLNLPAQARKILSKQEKKSPFDCLWLLDAKGQSIASSLSDEGILLPPIMPELSRYSFLEWNQALSAIFVNPIMHRNEVAGYLVALSSFPDHKVFERIDHEDDIGLAIWLDDSPATMSEWLRKTAYSKHGLPANRTELALTIDDSPHPFMTTPFSLPGLENTQPLRGELIRSLRGAEQPFSLVNISFYVSLGIILLSMALFSRYVSVQVIKPIQKLSHNADSIRDKGYAADIHKITIKAASNNEVSALYRSFYEMVKSLNEARTKAEQAEKVKTDFLSVVSHELRTPMTSVLGFTKMNRKRLSDHIYSKLDADEDTNRAIVQVENNFDIIISEGNRLTDLINDVLDIAKLESGAFEWNMIPVSVEELLRQSLAACTSLFIDKSLDYQLSTEESLPEVTADYDKLMQVVINFLSNAIKFTNKGEIICKAYRNDAEVIISIKDSGIGIPEDEQELIFQRFHQRRETLTDKPQGTGLGLPICKSIIEAHKGRIWLESTPGQGSTFYFSLPVS